MRCGNLGRVVVAVAALAALGLAAAAPESGPAVGDLGGLQERARQDRGRPLLINFWATWCRPCVEEFPTLNGLQEQFPGARFLAVSLDPLVYPDREEALTKVAELVREHPLHLPMFLYEGDPEALQQAYGLSPGLPHTMLLDADGEVVDRVEGALDAGEVDRLTERIRVLTASH